MITAISTSRDRKENLLVVCGCSDGKVHILQVDDFAVQLEFRPTELKGKSAQVNALMATRCQERYVVIGWWSDGTVLAFDQESGDITGRWYGKHGDSLLKPLTLATISKDSLELLAIADDAELVLLALPGLEVLARLPDAAPASIYRLFPLEWNGTTAMLSVGDTVSDGDRTERFPLKLWSLPDLHLLFEGAEELSLISRDSLIVEVAGESFLLAHEWGTIAYWYGLRPSDVVNTGIRSYAQIIAFYVDKARNFLLLDSSGSLEAYELRSLQRDQKTRARSMADMGLTLERLPVAADLVGGRWSQVVLFRDRPVIMSVDQTSVRLWDVRELIETASTPKSSSFLGESLTALGSGGNMIIAGSDAGSLLAWDLEGNLVWSKKIPASRIRQIKITKTARTQEVVVAARHGQLHRLDLRTGENLVTPLAAGTEILGMDIQTLEGRLIVFAGVNVRPSGRKGLYFVRAWDLESGAEQVTWLSPVGPCAAMGDEVDFDRGNEGVNGFEPALAMAGYFRSKMLFAVSAFDAGECMAVALAGPHGEVRVIEVPSLRELETWQAGTRGVDIYCLIGGLIDGVPLVFGGDASGILFRGSIPFMASESVCIERAHSGGINTLILHAALQGWVLASGGSDGLVQLWSTSLKRLLTIEAERPVCALAWVGESGLAVGTDRGVMNLKINWEKVFAEGIES
jgi:WD40 repeat protein